MSSLPPPPQPPARPPASSAGTVLATRPRGTRLRIVPITLLTLATLVVVAYAVGVVLTRGKIPHGTSIGGVDVGGKTVAQARALITTDLAGKAGQPIPVAAGDLHTTVDPQQAGLSLDVPASVAELDSTGLSPAAILRGLGKGTSHQPVLKVDESKLAAAVAAIATKVDRPVQEGKVSYNGVTPVAVNPTVGLTLDRKQAAAAIESRFRSLQPSSTPVALTVDQTQPTSSAQQIQTALTQLAAPAVAGPLHLQYGTTTVDVPPATLAAALSFSAGTGGAIQPVVDSATVTSDIVPLLSTTPAVTPQDAKITLVNGKPHITPSVSASTPDPTGLAQAIQTAIASGNRTVTVPSKTTDPAFTTADAQKLGIKEVVGEFSTPHRCCQPRVHNIALAASTINGLIVQPGAQFSLNQALGERTAAKGYVSAPEIEEGKDRPGVGGGVSQLSTTVFNASFFAGMEEIYHQPHTFWISRYPQGREATVSWPNPQMIWQNNTPYGVLVQAWDDGSNTHVALWSTKYWTVTSGSSAPYKVTPPPTTYLEPGESVQQCQLADLPGESGFTITIWRKLALNGAVQESKTWTWRYLPQPHHVCTPNPASPSPGTSMSPGAPGSMSPGAPGSPTPGTSPTPAKPTTTPSPNPPPTTPKPGTTSKHATTPATPVPTKH